MASKPKTTTLSIVIPAFNEEKNIKWLYSNLSKYLKTIPDHEIIFVNDGSHDDTLGAIKSLSKDNPEKVKYVSFSRNFGKEAATSAGINKATGRAVLLIDADGQHPAELIPEFVKKWGEGYEVVIGVRVSNKNEGIIKKYGSKLFYGFMSFLGQKGMIAGATDYRLLDRKVVDAFLNFTERSRMTRGIVDWLGFKRYYIKFSANERHHGKAAYSPRKLLRLAINGVVSHSTRPLQASGILGALVTLLSGTAGAVVVINKIAGDPMNLNISGSAILGVFISFMMGIVLICQGLLALYIENIYKETQNRPLYIVSEEY